MADGEIQLAVELTLGDITKSTKQLKSELQQIFNQNVGNKSMQGILTQIDKTISRATALEQKIKTLSATRVTNPELEQIAVQLRSARTEADGYKKTLEQLRSSGKSSKSSEVMFYTQAFEKANEKATELQAKLDHLQMTKPTISAIDTDAGQRALAQLNEINNQMVMLKTRATGSADSTTQLSARFKEVSKAAQVVGSAISSMAQTIRGVIRTGISLVSKFASAIKGTLLGAVNTVKKAFDRIKSSIEKAFSAKTFKRNLTTLLKYTLGVRSLYFAFRKLRSAITEGLKNLVQFQSDINETNRQMTEFQTSLLYLKNAWAAAFAPIINVVMPILTALIDMLASVGNAIARFIAALTGQATVIQALRVGVGDYAKSLQGAGGSAKKAADEQKKLNDRLAAFDDLNVLGKDKEDEDTGAGGGGGGGNLPSVNEMFERIETPMSHLADLIKQAWETGDFFKVGEFLGEQLKESLINLDTWILTEGRALGMKIASSIGTLIDGFISVDNLGHVIGATLGRAVELGIDMINEIIQPSRFMKIGEFIVEGFNAFIPIVVPKLGELIGNLLHSAISLGFGFIEGADWTGWGESIASAINNFFVEMSKRDTKNGSGLTGWQELGKGLSDGAKGLLDMIITAIKDLNPEDIRIAIEEFLEMIDWDGIKEKLKELWGTVWDFLGEAFPDTDWESIRTVLENVAQAASAVAQAVAEYISGLDWDKVKEVILTITDKLKDITADDIERLINAIVDISKFILRLAVVVEILNGLAHVVFIFNNLKILLTPLTGVLKSMVSYLGGVKIAIPLIGKAIASLAFDIGALIVGFEAIKVGWREIVEGLGDIALNWDEFEATGGSIGEAILGGVSGFFESSTEGWVGIVDTFNKSGISGVLDLFGAALRDDDEYLTTWADDLVNSEDTITHWGDTLESTFTVENFRTGWDAIGEYWSTTWSDMQSESSEIWASMKEGWSILRDNFAVIGEDFKTHLEDWKGNFELGLNAIKDKFTEWKDHITEKVDNIRDKFEEAKSNFAELWQGIKDDFVEKKEAFIEAIEELKENLDFSEVWTQIKQAFTSGVNGVIDIINGWLQRLADGVNGLANLLNQFSLDIPEVNIGGTTYGGGTIGFAVPTISAPQIPYLAQGAVIPPNKEFMAVLGDQRNGTNIEAPLDTIKQAVGEEFAPYFEQLIEATMEVVRAVNNKELAIGDKAIGQANQRYLNRQNIIKGTML